MADVTEQHETPEGVLNGTISKDQEKVPTVEGEGDEREESDNFDEDGVDDEEEKQIVGDEDDYEEEEEGEDDADAEEGEGGNNLTHLLLANPNGPVDGDDIDDEEDSAEEEDEEYTPAAPAPVAAVPMSRKRSIQEVVDVDEEEEQGAKKVKA